MEVDWRAFSLRAVPFSLYLGGFGEPKREISRKHNFHSRRLIKKQNWNH